MSTHQVLERCLPSQCVVLMRSLAEEVLLSFLPEMGHTQVLRLRIISLNVHAAFGDAYGRRLAEEVPSSSSRSTGEFFESPV